MASRREFLKDSLAIAGAGALAGCAPMRTAEAADTLIINGRVATLDPKQPNAEAIAIRGERIVAAGTDHQVSSLKGPNTRVIDAGRRVVIPGLNDAHTHFIRGGLTYTNEVRWDGVPSLAVALQMLKEQAARTPAPHW